MRIFVPLLMLAGIVLAVVAVGNVLMAFGRVSLGPVTAAVPAALAIGIVITLAACHGARSRTPQALAADQARPQQEDRAA
ncbi:MAG: hypothetical protein NTZ05_08765 [Chloroflexi bacterium]|nr:hypothetical protein [Chloroflexota bacterium]